ncbi:hypothetical protein [Intestinimonas massiliensis (ex Afouda et al. 2020)]|jgi:hypothetical protein|uniref:Uncharacterized protein n=1 Tax=Intestinimonas massiliensis (ex Afouda et al. 2020) TaxID=1673721 RepID=A0ABS9M424_9FIRM|nr:hypothetical protein [Intestinimonas massiliensis (ex Afouda et al. 2020)]MCG4525537.1 hypothetical protein [Intestinimonas massiliensis (ex Afouda et al. 2020)]
MSDLLAAVGQVFTSAMTMVGTVAGSIAGFTTSEGGVVTFNNPVLLLFCVAVPLCGLGVGMFARLLRSRG